MVEGISDETSNEAINRLVLHLFSLVSNGLRKATSAFLAQDRAAASAIIAGDTEFDTIEDEVEALVEQELANGPSADLRFLLAVLRIVPELERSGDLVEHIALRTQQGMGGRISARAQGLVQQMGDVGVELWRRVRPVADVLPMFTERGRGEFDLFRTTRPCGKLSAWRRREALPTRPSPPLRRWAARGWGCSTPSASSSASSSGPASTRRCRSSSATPTAR